LHRRPHPGLRRDQRPPGRRPRPARRPPLPLRARGGRRRARRHREDRRGEPGHRPAGEVVTATHHDHGAPAEPVAVDLEVEGMTCASCAARIEKKLNRLDGVEATVNYATDKARVRYDPGKVAPEQLVEVVTGLGYGATLPPPPAPARTHHGHEGHDHHEGGGHGGG